MVPGAPAMSPLGATARYESTKADNQGPPGSALLTQGGAWGGPWYLLSG